SIEGPRGTSSPTTRRGFHGGDAVAPLKERRALVRQPGVSVFPRRRRRGSIEGTVHAPHPTAPVSFPRRRRRGSIEGRPRHQREHQVRDVSTAATPWLH